MKVRFREASGFRCSPIILAVELGLVIGKGGRDISEGNAGEHIAGYGLYTKPCLFEDRVLTPFSSRH
jgi:hypothetical protein